MLLWISIFGGLLIMMGHHSRSEALFYYFRLEDQVPENHLLRLIDKHISFEFVREQLKSSYSESGRPSIDPELLLRILLIGYLYGITSERKLVEELRMHLAWRWFTGLSFDQEIPHHSTFSKNRHGRFQESKLFEELFERIVRQCMEVGLVQGQELSVDGSFVEANAAKESRVPRQQLVEAAQVHYTLRQYLKEVEEQTAGEVQLSTGTLYGIIKRLLGDGLIVESRHRPAEDDDSRRRYYRLTEDGRQVAVVEAIRMEKLLARARSKRLLKALKPA
jgi:transposase/DNA-binding MarR family transcriptional regulator